VNFEIPFDRHFCSQTLIDAKWGLGAVSGFDSICFLGVFEKLKKKERLLVSPCQSVCPHVTTRLPLDGFSRNSVFEYFSKICRGH